MILNKIKSFFSQAFVFFVILFILSNIVPFYGSKPWSSIHLVPDVFTARLYILVYVAIQFVATFYLFVLPYSYLRYSMNTKFVKSWVRIPLAISSFIAIAIAIASLPLFFYGEDLYRVANAIYPIVSILNVATYIVQWFAIPVLISLVAFNAITGISYTDIVKRYRSALVKASILCFLILAFLRPCLDIVISLGIAFSTGCLPCAMIYVRGYHPEAYRYLTLILQGAKEGMYMMFPTWGFVVAEIVSCYLIGKILYRYIPYPALRYTSRS